MLVHTSKEETEEYLYISEKIIKLLGQQYLEYECVDLRQQADSIYAFLELSLMDNSYLLSVLGAKIDLTISEFLFNLHPSKF